MKGLADPVERGEGGLNVQVPAEIAIYVEELGHVAAIELFLTMGGAYCYFATEPQAGSEISRVIGTEGVGRIARRLKAGGRQFANRVRVPLAKAWVARYLFAEGWTIADIARRVRVSDVTVKSYITPTGRRAGPNLFDWADQP